MSAANFQRALREVLEHEGGYANDPQDPGGETNYGITKATARAHGYRGAMLALPMQLVRDIYHRSYWAAVRGDDLPTGVDLAAFDFAVNSGPHRAAEFLQRCVNVDVDGKIGPITLRAIAGEDPAELAVSLCVDRLSWLRTLRKWPRFGRGWTRRVQSVERASVAWALAERKSKGAPQ